MKLKKLRTSDQELIYRMLIEAVIIDLPGRYILNADSEAERTLTPQEVRIIQTIEQRNDIKVNQT